MSFCSVLAGLPAAGRYLLFDEFATLGGQDVVLCDAMAVPGAGPTAAHLVPDTASRLLHGVRIRLQGAGGLLWGRPSRLTFLVTDPWTGLPLYGLQPYLGAPAHIAILSQDGSWFLHTHGMNPGSAGMTMAMGPAAPSVDTSAAHAHSGDVGPTIQFDPTFPGPGLYKIWGQFETVDRTVITADFVVEVK